LRVHLAQHCVDKVGSVTLQFDKAPPSVALLGATHAPPEERLHVYGEQRCLVAPILEQLTGFGHARQHVARVRADACEQRQLLGAHENVHRVDLQQTDLVEDAAHMAAIDATSGARRCEALRGQRDSARLIGAQAYGPRDRCAAQPAICWRMMLSALPALNQAICSGLKV
jgi:hypothetical protein